MSTYTDDTVENGTGSESAAMAVASSVADSYGTISDCIHLSVDVVTVESGTLTTDDEENFYTQVFERGTLAELFSNEDTSNLVEHGRMSDASLSVLFDDLIENGTFSESLKLTVASLSVDSGTISDVISSPSSLTNILVEAGVISDKQGLSLASLLEESGTFSDDTAQATVITTIVIDNGTLGETVVVSTLLANDIVDSGVLADIVSIGLTAAYNTVVESGFVDDVVIGGGTPGAWHSHLETFAMTRYTNYPFNSMAVVDGEVLGASEDGIYRVAGDTDDGAQIAATVQHDWEDKVADQKGEMVTEGHLKHARYAYLDGTTDGRLSFVIGYTNINGQEVISDAYVMPARGQTGVVNNRVELGRGIRSRFLSPRLLNVDGSDFSVNDAKLIVNVVKRNI